MEDAEIAVFKLNSAAEVCKDVADRLANKGLKQVSFPQIFICPFPQKQFDYYGHNPGKPEFAPKWVLNPMKKEDQLSYSTPMGHMTSPSNIGGFQNGKPFHHKDTAQIMAATHIPYVFTGTEAFDRDLLKKAAKVQ